MYYLTDELLGFKISLVFQGYTAFQLGYQNFKALCQGGPRRSPEIQSTLVWSSCWGATEGAGRSTQRGEQRRVVRARGNKGEVGVTRDQV